MSDPVRARQARAGALGQRYLSRCTKLALDELLMKDSAMGCGFEGERGERGKRGKRGHRGHRGPPGPGVARQIFASCTVDGSVPAYLNVMGFGLLTRNGPVGDYLLGLPPGADLAKVNLVTGVFARDGQPALLTILPGPSGTLRILVVHLDGTPVDVIFSLVGFAAP
jgi:hypothetical protein